MSTPMNKWNVGSAEIMQTNNLIPWIVQQQQVARNSGNQYTSVKLENHSLSPKQSLIFWASHLLSWLGEYSEPDPGPGGTNHYPLQNREMQSIVAEPSALTRLLGAGGWLDVTLHLQWIYSFYLCKECNCQHILSHSVPINVNILFLF